MYWMIWQVAYLKDVKDSQIEIQIDANSNGRFAERAQHTCLPLITRVGVVVGLMEERGLLN